MMLDELLPLVKGVKKSGAGYLGPCAAHADKSPSLSIREGERGLLLKCWAGCTIDEICRALGIQQRDLFYDALDANPRQRQAAAQRRAAEKAVRERTATANGTTIDALREAERFIESRCGLDISSWTDHELNTELSALADAYHLLEVEHGY